MAVITPIHAFVSKSGLAPARLRRWHRGTGMQPDTATPADASRISPRVVIPAVVVTALLLWFALIELILLAARSSLFS